MVDFEYWKSEKQGTEFIQSRQFNIGIMLPYDACWVIDKYLEPNKLASDYSRCEEIHYLKEKMLEEINTNQISS